MNDNKKLIKNFLNCCQVSLMGNSLGWLHPWKPAGCGGWRWPSESFSNSLWPRKLLAGLSAPRQLPFAAHPLNFPLVGREVQSRTLVTGPVSPSRGPAFPPTDANFLLSLYKVLRSRGPRASKSAVFRQWPSDLSVYCVLASTLQPR